MNFWLSLTFLRRTTSTTTIKLSLFIQLKLLPFLLFYFYQLVVEKQVFNNFVRFQDFKNPGYPLFKRINATEVNEYLNNMMPGLTTHTFRTMKASRVFETELEHGAARGSEPQDLLDSFEEASWVVAKLCNHQKTSKTMAEIATSPLVRLLRDPRILINLIPGFFGISRSP